MRSYEKPFLLRLVRIHGWTTQTSVLFRLFWYHNPYLKDIYCRYWGYSSFMRILGQRHANRTNFLHFWYYPDALLVRYPAHKIDFPAFNEEWYLKEKMYLNERGIWVKREITKILIPVESHARLKHKPWENCLIKKLQILAKQYHICVDLGAFWHVIF